MNENVLFRFVDFEYSLLFFLVVFFGAIYKFLINGEV